MKLFSKISKLLLLATFMLSNIAGASGLVFCFADDGHVEFEYASEGRCRDGYVIDIDIPDNEVISISAPTESHCGSCNDLDISHTDTTFTKRLLNKSLSSLDIPQMDKVFPYSGSFDRLVLSNFAPQPPPRISQAVLNHRTTVLLI